MAVRKTFAWVLFLLLVAGGVGGTYVYSLLQRTNELLEEQVLKAFEERAPDWNLELGSARFDFDGKIRLYDLKLRTAPDTPPLFSIPETVVTVDRDQLAQQRILIHHVQLLQPQVSLIRDQIGHWNWQDLPPLPSSDAPLPECRILQGQIHLQLAPEDAHTRGLMLREIDLRLVPLGKRQLQAMGVTTVDQAGRLSLEGECDLSNQTWTVKGSIARLKAGAELVRMVAGISPEVRENLDRLFAKLRPSAAESVEMQAEPSIEAMMDVHFRVSQWKADGVQEYKVLMNLLSGTVSHPQLPFPLQDIKGKLYCDNRQLLIQTLTARNGRTQLLADGRLIRQVDANPGTIAVRIRDLPLDQRLRNRLPGKLQEQFDAINPTGQVDANFDLTYDGRSTWSCVSEITTKECTAAHEKFPYLVEKVQGTLIHAGDLVEISMQGLAGTRPITLAGRVRLGDAQRSDFVIRTSGIPLDQRFLDAAPPAMRRTLEAMNIKGTADLVYQMSRVGGGDVPYQTRLKGQLRGCTMAFSGFPYEVEQLSGNVDFDGMNWSFQELQGVHGKGILKGAGTYLKKNEDDSGLLDLRIQVAQGTLDTSLKSALSKGWQATWDEISPSGRLDLETRVLWTPGESPRIDLNAQVSEAAVSLRSFPYPLDDVTARLSMVGNRVNIESFSGSHDETQVQMSGWAMIEDSGEWRVRIEKMNIDDLEPGRRFRRALPAGFREVFESLDPRQGLLSISGMLEFRGTGHPEDDVTAAWDVETVYTGATLTAGVDLEKLYGSALSRGTWDGERVVSNGRLKLDSVTINGYQFTDVTGPWAINGNQLVIGSKEMVNVTGADRNALRIATENRVTAEAIDGLFTLDGIAVLDETTSYRVLITMNGTRLERYAKLYMPPGRNTLQGVMNGWIELSGRGSSAQRVNGRGQLQISPAALYELPVMLAIFKIMNFGTPDKTAFDHAFVQFDVTGGQYILRQIDLIGDAISFRGHGYVRFDGRLSLDFYSRVARNQLPIPLVQDLLGEATKGWFGVEVRGSTADPVATLKPVPRLDDALKGFLGVFDQRAQPPRPPSFIPELSRRPR